MDEFLGLLAFALLIGGQFLAAIVLISKRDIIYADPREQVREPARPTGGHAQPSTLQPRASWPIALARLGLAGRADGLKLQRTRDKEQDPSHRQLHGSTPA